MFEKWKNLASAGVDPRGPEASEVAALHYAWLSSIPGGPADSDAYVKGLAEMYVADPRFAKNFEIEPGDMSGAAFVRDALIAFVEAK